MVTSLCPPHLTQAPWPRSNSLVVPRAFVTRQACCRRDNLSSSVRQSSQKAKSGLSLSQECVRSAIVLSSCVCSTAALHSSSVPGPNTRVKMASTLASWRVGELARVVEGVGELGSGEAGGDGGVAGDCDAFDKGHIPGAKVRLRGGLLMSGLKPGPILEAKARATAGPSTAHVARARRASLRMTSNRQIRGGPRGAQNDKQGWGAR